MVAGEPLSLANQAEPLAKRAVVLQLHVKRFVDEEKVANQHPPTCSSMNGKKMKGWFLAALLWFCTKEGHCIGEAHLPSYVTRGKGKSEEMRVQLEVHQLISPSNLMGQAQISQAETVKGIIASLLNCQIHERLLPACRMGSCHNRSTSESSAFESSAPADDEYAAEQNLASAHLECPSRSLQKCDKLIDVLRRMCGND